MGILDLLKLPFLIVYYVLEFAWVLVSIPLKILGFIFGSGGGCPNCGSNKIQQLPSGGHQCKNCGYAE